MPNVILPEISVAVVSAGAGGDVPALAPAAAVGLTGLTDPMCPNIVKSPPTTCASPPYVVFVATFFASLS